MKFDSAGLKLSGFFLYHRLNVIVFCDKKKRAFTVPATSQMRIGWGLAQYDFFKDPIYFRINPLSVSVYT